MILYISGCEDGTTAEEFIEKNGKDEEDKDLKELIDSLKLQTEKNKKKGIELENIITGVMLSHQDQETDERNFLDDRKKTLKKIMTVIDIDIRVRTNLWIAIGEWFIWHFKKLIPFKKNVTSTQNIVEKMANNSTAEVVYVYGECFICSIDKHKGWIMIKPCLHRFHNHCLRLHFIFVNIACPKCDGEIREIENLP